MGKTTGTRRRGRILAVQVLYGMDMSGNPDFDTAFARNPAVLREESEQAREFARNLAQGVFSHTDELDAVIARHSTHWRVERMAKVDLAILRLAVYEMLHEPDIPEKVTINEAVDLAKSLADETSGTFVNGILDAVARSGKAK